ncbi:VOC family protein [uncultured Ferrimonas sp.]|uniref:VOC family protein n=1 Tax=uncultured Ferrimonas sp. TaxID=432640 RepID=UPI00262CD3EE|nr:VOC family protein [uncultured Ferrimonas sp.]
MIGYVTVGTNDLDRAAAFFDGLFASIGGKRFMQEEQFIAWQVNSEQSGIAATKPFDGQPATAGNGTMVALAFDSPAQVDAFYHKAIELGAQCEGPAGPRGGGFYAGYFRDLDGNKFNGFCMTST